MKKQAVECRFFREDATLLDGGRCELGKGGGRPSYGVCAKCPESGAVTPPKSKRRAGYQPCTNCRGL